MSPNVSYYLDEHMQRSVADALHQHGIKVVMAVDVGMVGKDDDAEHLPYATALGAVVVTRDHPFAGRTANRTDHAGLICWTGSPSDIGGMVKMLVRFAETYQAEAIIGQVFWFNA